MSNLRAPSADPGSRPRCTWQFSGYYDASAVVTFGVGNPPILMTSSTPTQIVHGTQQAIMIDGGQCLYPQDLTSTPDAFTLHLPSTCSRSVRVGDTFGMANLQFLTGQGTIHSAGDLNFTSSGRFSFMPNGDARTAMPGTGMCSSVTINGSRQ